MDLGRPEKRNHVTPEKSIKAKCNVWYLGQSNHQFNINWGMNRLTAALQRWTQGYWQMKS